MPEPHYPDDHGLGDVVKVDIEQINIVSDDDEPQYLGTRKVTGKHKGLRPIRLMREEHKERGVLVNTDIKAQPESDDDELPTIDEFRSSKGAEQANMYSTPGDVKIKDEPRGTPEPEDLAVKSSPDSRRKAQDSLASAIPMNIDLDPPASAKKSKRPAKKNKIPEVVHQTDEDREEWHRHLEDVKILSEELVSLRREQPDKGKDVEGDTTMDGLADAAARQKDEEDGNGRLYLFQFPPVLPELYNPKDPKPKNPILVKREAEEAAAHLKEEVEVLGSLTAKARSKMKEQPDIKDEAGAAPVVKKEEEGVETTAEKLKREAEEMKRKKGKPEVVREEGLVGKLVVRKSGKVELIWGGTTLLVGRGADASFLTTGVIVDSVERGPQGGGAPEGKAVGMGQIMGKFVVTPDWENY